MKIPEGWKLVPVEPTEEMIDKADAYAVSGMHEGNYRSYLAEIFRIMLAAAPEPQMTGAQWLNRPLYDEDMTNLRERVKELELLNHAARVSIVRLVNENQRSKAKMTRHGDDDELMQAMQRLLAVLIRRADAS